MKKLVIPFRVRVRAFRVDSKSKILPRLKFLVPYYVDSSTVHTDDGTAESNRVSRVSLSSLS